MPERAADEPMVLVRMPLSGCRAVAGAPAAAEVDEPLGTGAIDPVAALERVPDGGRRDQASYVLPVSHRLAVEAIRTELMHSRGLAAGWVSRARVVAAAIALYYEDVFGRKIDEPKDPPQRNPGTT